MSVLSCLHALHPSPSEDTKAELSLSSSGDEHHAGILQHGLHLRVHLHLLHPHPAWQRDNVLEDKTNALIEAAGVNVEPFWPRLSAKVLAKVDTGSLLCNVGPGELLQELHLH